MELRELPLLPRDPVIRRRGDGQPVRLDNGGSARNTNVVLHLEFKGQFSWGQWVFYSKDIPIPAGSSTVSDEVNAPYKTLIEPASEFYYYVYATFPGDEWNPSAWGLAQPVTVLPPVDVTYDELVSCMSHLKWLVDTSSLSTA